MTAAASQSKPARIDILLDAVRHRHDLTPEGLEAAATAIATLVPLDGLSWSLANPGEHSSQAVRPTSRAGNKLVFTTGIVPQDTYRLMRARYLVTCQQEIGNAIRKRFPAK